MHAFTEVTFLFLYIYWAYVRYSKFMIKLPQKFPKNARNPTILDYCKAYDAIRLSYSQGFYYVIYVINNKQIFWLKHIKNCLKQIFI